jgi:hypothetical protein
MTTPKLAAVPPDANPVARAQPTGAQLLDAPPVSDAVPMQLREVIALFAGPLAGIAFPDIDAALLGRHAEALRTAARDLDRARAAVDDAQRRVVDRTAELAAAGRRGLAYARIYADAHPELALAAAVTAIEIAPILAAAPPPARRGRPRKHPRPELPFAATAPAADSAR